MEKRGSRCPKDACKRIRRAVAASPAYHTVRRISYILPNSRSASPATNSSPPAKAIDLQSKSGSSKHPKSDRNREVAASVPITFDYSSQNEKPTLLELIQKNTQIARVAPKIESDGAPAKTIAGEVTKTKVNPEVKLEKGGKSGVHIEDRITDYINRAKFKIRTMSRSSEGKYGSGKDKDKLSDDTSGKDKFSDFIDRTRNKLKKASSIGAGKSHSFK